MNCVFCRLILLALGFGLISSQAAPTLTLSTSSLPSDTNAFLVHTITGVAAGETVTVERFADLNGNGVIDPGEPAFRSFLVTDGVQSKFGGVVNGNVANDADDAANGAIQVNLAFPGVDEIINRQPGKYVIRASGVSGAATAAFEITAPNLPQRVTGVLKSSANNATIPFGIVVIVVGDGSPIGSVRTDSSGAFNFIAPAGDYGLIPFADGFVAPMQFVSLPASQTVTNNLTLVPATIQVSGKLSDASSGVGLPRVFVIAQNNSSQLGGGFTDANGNYSFNVTADSWELQPVEQFVAQLGYVNDKNGPTIAAVSAPITQNMTAQKATALIYGHITNPSNKAVPGLALKGRQNTPQNLQSEARTTANGDYFIGATDGAWDVSTDGAALLGYREDQHSFTVAAGSATQADIQLVGFTAHVRGTVTDDGRNPLSNVLIAGRFENSNGISSSTTSEVDGSFDLPVWGGNWSFRVGSDGNPIARIYNLTVADGVDQQVAFIVPTSTASISGFVHDSGNHGLAGFTVVGSAHINGADYVAQGQTDGSGNYSMPVINGAWNVSINCGDAEALSLDCPLSQTANISQPAQNATINFTLQNFVTTATLTGRVVDGSGHGISGQQVGAFSQTTGANRIGSSQNDGSFSIPVYAGQWFLQANNVPSRQISSSQILSVTDGVNINNLQLKVLLADRTISGTVKNALGAGVPGVRAYAIAIIDSGSFGLPYVTTDASGNFSFKVAAGSWSVSLDCGDLNALQYNCVNNQPADTASGSATANFTVVPKGTVTRSSISSPAIAENGGQTVFTFTLGGNPGTYDIQGSSTLPFGSAPSIANTATISPGNSSVFVSFSPGTNQFFRVIAR